MMAAKKVEVRWDWIGAAWKMYTNQPGAWIGMVLITGIIGILLVALPIVLILIPAGIFAANGETGGIFAAAGLTLLLLPVLLIAWLLLGTYLTSGMYRAAIRQAQGQSVAVGDLFSGGDCFPRVLGLMILGIIANCVVGFVFAVPGMIIDGLAPLGNLAYIVSVIIYGFIFFAIPLIIDRNMGVFAAISASIEATKSQWWMFAIFVVALGLLSFAGAPCLVGLLVTLPFLFTTTAVAYRDTFGLPGAQDYDVFTPPAPPDYRGYTPSQAPAEQPAPPPWAAQTFVSPSVAPPAPAPESTSGTCPHCGATLARVMNFCNQCGHPLRSA
ncbi:MAG TPA: zinc-ribbon domain-containing protein [Blastocatellia bacterium]